MSVTFSFSTTDALHCTEMESHNLHLHRPLFMYSDSAKKLQRQVKNPIVKHMIKICCDSNKYLNRTILHNLVQYGVIIS